MVLMGGDLSEEVMVMTQWRLKACSKCHGDVFVDRDLDGWYEQCLQCGYRRELQDIKTFKRHGVTAGVGNKEVDLEHEDWSIETE
jgi:hypothetical protein